MTDKEEILNAIGGLSDRISHVEITIGQIQTQIVELKTEVRVQSDRLETYQKASDRLIGLVTTIIAGASAVIILAPLGRVIADFSAKTLGV